MYKSNGGEMQKARKVTVWRKWQVVPIGIVYYLTMAGSKALARAKGATNAK
jgi:hypothetical protein